MDLRKNSHIFRNSCYLVSLPQFPIINSQIFTYVLLRECYFVLIQLSTRYAVYSSDLFSQKKLAYVHVYIYIYIYICYKLTSFDWKYFISIFMQFNCQCLKISIKYKENYISAKSSNFE